MSNNKQLTEPMVISQTASTDTAQGIYVQHLKKKKTMSNNKESMKLYTEEQVKQIQQAILCNYKDAIMDENYCLNVTTPIELPSDEEIEQLANDYRSISEFCDIEYFADGAVFAIKWMRDKIQGGNK